jgi:DNA-binding PadR family transcriptional regulator
MKSYSDSPGAIYPALRRLDQHGLIRGRIQQGPGLRRRQVFHVTAKGMAELKKWIVRPITQDDLAGGLKEVMLRFAFSERAAGADVSVQLIRDLRAQLEEYVPTLHTQLTAGKAAMSRSGRLALESGIWSYESLLEWTNHALANYAGKE